MGLALSDVVRIALTKTAGGVVRFERTGFERTGRPADLFDK